jgi:protein farnesyltransferase/geranylgeranyltransferase type-1 subunit alpha
LAEETARREADYAIEIASIDPYNESPWRYLIGILKEQNTPAMVDHYLKAATNVKQVLEDAGRDQEACANLNSARIDMLEMSGTTECLIDAIDMCKAMATQYDLIRRKYWKFRVDELEKKRGASH